MPVDVYKFFRNAFSVFFVFSFLMGLVFFAIPPDPGHPFVISLAKRDLLKNTPSPRVIVVGGSNVMYGVDTELMQSQLGLPVVNDGLHGAIGLLAIREVRDYLREGDMIVISMEYSSFVQQIIIDGDPAYTSIWIEYMPSRAKYLKDPFRSIPYIYLVMIQKKVIRMFNYLLYNGKPAEGIHLVFNKNADYIGHINVKSPQGTVINNNAYPVGAPKEGAITLLKDFNEYALAHGAVVYLAAPASRELNCKKTPTAKIVKLLDTVSRKTGIPLLTQPDQICFPNSYFYDTEYHLNAEGRQIRTQYLIDALKPLISK